MDLTTRKLLHSLSALSQVGVEFSTNQNFEEVVRSSLHALLGALAIPRGAVARISSKPLQLKVIAARGQTSARGQKLSLERGEADLIRSLLEPLELAADGALLGRFVERNSEILKRLKVTNAYPLVVRGELLGVILFSRRINGEQFDKDDFEIIGAIARHIAIGLHNHRLIVSLKRRAEENRRMYREMRQVYRDTVRAFGAAIDLKDTYTSGHSDRVARYSEAIAHEMGMSGDELEYIGVAGYLHDIGKIVVDRTIINNPRPLTEKEFGELNRHVTTGYEILSQIPHPWKEIAYMTRCHHERYDGNGYPEGLKGDQIPLGSMIVTLADSLDAMMTDRPYRARLSLPRALEEVRACSGRHFSPEVVMAFCRLLLKEINGMVRRPVILSMVGARFDRPTVSRQLMSIISEISSQQQVKSAACP